MKKYKVIYNPSSGNELVQNKIFQISKNILVSEDVTFTFYATKKEGDAQKAATNACSEGFELIIACGGDGTINEVVNGIMNSPCKSKLAVLPSGTVNDFATYMEIPTTVHDFTKLLKNQTYQKVDVGKANDKYFINVASGGAFTNIPYDVPSETKTILGKYSYYIRAAMEIPQQIEKSYKIKVTTEERTLELNALVFLISNTPSIGGFKKFSPDAKYNDGFFDVLVIEHSPPFELLNLFAKLLSGDHIHHKKVHYFKSKKVKIDSASDLVIDLDGEYGFKAPIEISMINEGLELLTPKKV
ncbi:MAG: YegS/Rv2252/BmrU family lipid kinase [Tissierellales bacterium]|jgi:diacylglycerol kinase (ATP)|nr:YegS/Rv2252/BmrU family lipid kinase [Tissierellales bacterium]